MTRYVALFRGINVGGNNKLPMKSLVSIMEDHGCINVQTYIQSGNVVFDLKDELSVSKREEILETIFGIHGFKPDILFFEKERLSAAIKGNPFPCDNGKALHFYFMKSDATEAKIDELEDRRIESEKYHLTDHVFYLYAPDGIGRSKLAASAEKLLGVSVTARNWNTVEKLESMMGTA